MVRLEKQLWETFLNIGALGRARTLGRPSKFYNENRNDAYKVAAHKVFNQGISAKIFRFLEPLLARFTWQWMRDIALQRGLAMEDFLLFQDRELRRCYFFESVARQSLHPYTWVFFKRRRARFYKVERGVRGAYAPDWARKEGEDRTLAETLENKEIWENFMYKEYMSEQTPTSRWSVLSKWNPLDMFCLYGLWRPEAWDRYFYNEVYYEGYSQDEIKEAVMNPFPHINLATEDGRRQFEEEVKRFQKLYPGAATRAGEDFNFQKFYATWDLLNNRDLTKYEQQYITDLRNELAERKKSKYDEKGNHLGKLFGKTEPDFIRDKPGFTTYY